MDKQEYAQQFGRIIYDNEIVFDADDREKGFEAINFIGINLYNAGYKFEIWYAQGQKSPHLHVKGIKFLDLEGEQLMNFKKLFLKKYAGDYLGIIDIKLTGRHRIAEENKPHYKYNTIKKLQAVWNEGKENYSDPDMIVDAQKKVIEKREGQRELNLNGSGVTAKIVQSISIIDLAIECGIKVKGKMAVCPFHEDKTPSLSFNDSKGLFNCFGCNAHGNIIEFIYLLKNLKKNQKEMIQIEN